MREAGESHDQALLEAEMEKAVRHVVVKQKEAGIDIGNDGEQQRVGFQTYMPQRMSGFGGELKRRRGRDYEEFPDLRRATSRAAFPMRAGSKTRRRRRPRFTITTPPRSNEIARYQRIAAEEAVRRIVHDGAVARHHRFDHAQRLLRLAMKPTSPPSRAR